jgi:hypothetical protein
MSMLTSGQIAHAQAQLIAARATQASLQSRVLELERVLSLQQQQQQQIALSSLGLPGSMHAAALATGGLPQVLATLNAGASNALNVQNTQALLKMMQGQGAAFGSSNGISPPASVGRLSPTLVEHPPSTVGLPIGIPLVKKSGAGAAPAPAPMMQLQPGPPQAMQPYMHAPQPILAPPPQPIVAPQPIAPQQPIALPQSLPPPQQPTALPQPVAPPPQPVPAPPQTSPLMVPPQSISPPPTSALSPPDEPQLTAPAPAASLKRASPVEADAASSMLDLLSTVAGREAKPASPAESDEEAWRHSVLEPAPATTLAEADADGLSANDHLARALAGVGAAGSLARIRQQQANLNGSQAQASPSPSPPLPPTSPPAAQQQPFDAPVFQLKRQRVA